MSERSKFDLMPSRGGEYTAALEQEVRDLEGRVRDLDIENESLRATIRTYECEKTRQETKDLSRLRRHVVMLQAQLDKGNVTIKDLQTVIAENEHAI